MLKLVIYIAIGLPIAWIATGMAMKSTGIKGFLIGAAATVLVFTLDRLADLFFHLN